MGIKELESDFEMYKEAIQDLEENGGDNKIIIELRDKKNRMAQALNLLIVPNSNERYSFFVK